MAVSFNETRGGLEGAESRHDDGVTRGTRETSACYRERDTPHPCTRLTLNKKVYGVARCPMQFPGHRRKYVSERAPGNIIASRLMSLLSRVPFDLLVDFVLAFFSLLFSFPPFLFSTTDAETGIGVSKAIR